MPTYQFKEHTMFPTKSTFDDNRLLPVYWIGIALILAIADHLAGPFIQFPIVYLVPVALASWYSGLSWGLAFSFILPLIRLFFNIAVWTIPWTIFEASINCCIRIVVFSLFAILISRSSKRTRALSKEVHLLSGLLPICAYCKKIRDESSNWQPIESYISQRSDALFSHGCCPECAQKYFGDYLSKK